MEIISGSDNFNTLKNNIVHGDCLEVMKKLPDHCIDAIITSPPYNLLNSTGNGLKKNTRSGKWANAAIKIIMTICLMTNIFLGKKNVYMKCIV